MECLRFYDRANHHYAPASIHRDWALNNHRPRLNERALFLSLSLREREEGTDRHLRAQSLQSHASTFILPVLSRPVPSLGHSVLQMTSRRSHGDRSLFLLFASLALICASPSVLSFLSPDDVSSRFSPSPSPYAFFFLSLLNSFLSLVQISPSFTSDSRGFRFKLEAMRTR